MIKELFKTFVLAAGILALAACNEVGAADEAKDAASKLVINVNAGLGTKATTDVLAGEEAIRDIQIYIFRQSDNSLYRKIDTVFSTTQSRSAVRLEEYINADEEYYVAALVNGYAANPQCVYNNILSPRELRQQVVRLASSVPGTFFTMYGETDGLSGSSRPVRVEVGKTANVNVTVTRFVSRVRLLTVKNQLPEAYGKLDVEKVFVINACSRWNIGGDGTVVGQFNWSGSGNVSQRIIASANDAVYAEDNTTYAYGVHTYREQKTEIQNGVTHEFMSGGERSWPFYVFPNATADDSGSDSFRGSIGMGMQACTRLVVYASFQKGGETVRYYYPVSIPAMERNRSYDVNLLITGFGSEHPNKEPEKGAMSVSLSVKDWEEGKVIDQEY